MKTFIYFLTIAVFAAAIGWAFVVYFKPIVIERGCSEIAQGSSNILFKEQNKLDPKYNYQNVKTRCLNDALKN